DHDEVMNRRIAVAATILVAILAVVAIGQRAGITVAAVDGVVAGTQRHRRGNRRRQCRSEQPPGCAAESSTGSVCHRRPPSRTRGWGRERAPYSRRVVVE